MKLTDSIADLKGVGQKLSQQLGLLEIETIDDLVEYFPRRYEDYSKLVPIAKLKPGQASLQAKIQNPSSRYVRRGMHITEAVASDGSGSLRLVWFNQPYRSNSLKSGQEYFISGDFGLRRGRFSMVNPSVELVGDFPINTARIVPVYRQTKGLASHQLRRLLRQVLTEINKLDDNLPPSVIKPRRLVSYDQAVREMHFPSSPEALASAKKRLGFEEVFRLTLAALLNKYELYQNKALAIAFNAELAKRFVSNLPFKLTDAQRKVVWQVYQDMSKTQPMNRLIEGDVGSGKTVVAVMAALMALEQKFQVAMMAPTEILARQHAETVHNLLKSVGLNTKVSLLVGSQKADAKKALLSKIADGSAGLVIGTHALIQSGVKFKNLGLVIVDEQHRFGVEQRKKLQKKAGTMPHIMHMTATPIPRSLALTLYGELDISLLDTMPKGRGQIITELCSPNSRPALYKKIDARLQKGEQLFVICPKITDSLDGKNLSAEAVYEKLSSTDFKHRRVGLLHGRLNSEQKQTVMNNFVSGKLDILVSTTVVEVGVHVPGATMMLIESAERFGLAQIHQLRGRVGRESDKGYCFLMPSISSAPIERLRALEHTSDGFKLAELDLNLRGPGEIYGLAQHGALDLKVASLSDTKLIAEARQSAQQFIDSGEDLLKYPNLAKKVNNLRAITNLN